MTPEEYARLQSIFERVLACDEESREEALDRECGDDEALRREVERFWRVPANRRLLSRTA